MFHVSGHLKNRLLKYIWFWLPSVGMYLTIKWLISEITRNLLLSRPLHIISAVIVKMLIVSVVHIRCVVYWILHKVKSKLSAWWRSRNWLSLPVSPLAVCPTLVKSKFKMLTYDFSAGLNSCLQCYDTNMQCHRIMEISCWILTYLLLLEKLTGLQLVKKFPAFYGTWRFITALTSACHLSLS